MKRFKYPRTYHLPWSPGTTSDDRILKDVSNFYGKQVVVTDKLDGENTNLYQDHMHARSIDSGHHPSRNFVKKIHSEIKFEIPDGYRICGENVYAKHSIFYEKLESYFYVFGIYNNDNFCISWQETKEICHLLNLFTVPVLYEGIWNEDKIKSLFTGKSVLGGEQEGYVVRLAESFHYSDFANCCAKYVRASHVQTSVHWMTEKVVPNLLKQIEPN
ncbi:MAG: 2'-5' RNA ligase [Neisseriaceae bacterium]|nr:MAG: 2'-5' RNA ligase [Neisseriaceae bacterium]